MRAQAAPGPEAIIPNLHWNYSGVTATNRMVAPRIAALVRVAWLGPDRPEGLEKLSIGGLLCMRFRPERGRPAPVWHARRNNEMIVGALLRALGWRLTLVFTSAASRRKTWLTRLLIRRMDAVIAASTQAASFVERPSTVVPHGVDTDLFRPPADRSAALAEAGLPGRRAIGCFGRVRPQKGTDVFIEAMCRLLPRHKEHVAIVVGAIGREHEGFVSGLKARAAEAGIADRLLILGERPASELPTWFQRICIYAFTSRVEGFGLTLLEAMSSGTALVAARSGAAELVVSDGDTGLLVPPGDADALAAALEPLLADPALAEGFGRRARERAVRSYGIGTEAEAIVAVYRRAWSQSAC